MTETRTNLNSFLDPRRQPFKIEWGIPSFVKDVSGEEGHWNRIYDHLAPFYEYTERLLGKLILGVDFRDEWQRVAKAAGFS